MRRPVLIPALSERCVARSALDREGVDFVCEIMADDLHYGRFLAEHWYDEVIVLEHDVAPWWGAIDAIRGCPEPWCAYRYPFAPNALGWALGCLRVNPDLVSEFPDLPLRWEGVSWNGLDAKVVCALQSVSGKGDPHFHGPPLAHVKGLA